MLWVGPVGTPPRWAALAEANLWNAGFAGPIHAVAQHRPGTRRRPGSTTLRPLTLHRSWAWSACRSRSRCSCLSSWPTAAAGPVIIGGGAAPGTLTGEQTQAMRATARRLGVRVVGPDRVGVIVPRLRLNTGSAAALPQTGNLAFVTQSDSIATTMLDWAMTRRIGFSRIVSLGDSADVELGDILDYLAIDLATRAILIHLEGVADARPFMSAARAAAGIKPVIVIKAGRHMGPTSVRGRSGGSGCIATGFTMRRSTAPGWCASTRWSELFAAAATLGADGARRGHELRNGRLALLSNGNAPAEFAADVLLAGGGVLVRPTAEIHAAITRAVGDTASHASSIDLGLEATGETYAKALDVLLDTPGIDGLLVIHAPAAGIDPGDVAQAVAGAADRRRPRSAQRPILAAWLGESGIERALGPLDAAAIPAFTAPEPAVRAFLHRVAYERSQFLLHQVPSSRPDDTARRQQAATSIIDPALAQGRRSLTEVEAVAVLDAYGIPCVPTRLATDLDGAASAARALGYPVALKIVSAKLPQKSSIGGVALDINDKASLLRRGRQLLDRVAAAAPKAPIEGLLVQRMERSLRSVELYLGMEVDPTFGPILLLGHGALRAIGTDLTYLLPPLEFDAGARPGRRYARRPLPGPAARCRHVAGGPGGDLGPAVRSGGDAAQRPAGRHRPAAGRWPAPGRARRPYRSGPGPTR